MILYHFTAVESLDSILQHGLSRGNVNLSRTEIANAVWLTTAQHPNGHGLTRGEAVTNEHRESFFLRWRRSFPANVTHWPDKTAVRIKVVIPTMDRDLEPWSKWGRKHCDPDLFESLKEHDGASFKTWFVYFGTIEPQRFASIEVHGKPYMATDRLGEAA